MDQLLDFYLRFRLEANLGIAMMHNLQITEGISIVEQDFAICRAFKHIIEMFAGALFHYEWQALYGGSIYIKRRTFKGRKYLVCLAFV